MSPPEKISKTGFDKRRFFALEDLNPLRSYDFRLSGR